MFNAPYKNELIIIVDHCEVLASPPSYSPTKMIFIHLAPSKIEAFNMYLILEMCELLNSDLAVKL